MDAHVESLENKFDDQKAPLRLLSVVIPAHNEEGCIASTVEHLHLELRLQNVPHEIVVVDDGSTDATWQKLLGLREHIFALKPVQNQGPHGFGRAVEKGFASMSGDAAVVMMADLPLLSPHFNLTVELPLKTIVRGYSWTVMPITWRNRRVGNSKLSIKEMGSRYLFICLYVWLEKYFSRGDYKKQ